jgi:hypothetical protein
MINKRVQGLAVGVPLEETSNDILEEGNVEARVGAALESCRERGIKVSKRNHRVSRDYKRLGWMTFRPRYELSCSAILTIRQAGPVSHSGLTIVGFAEGTECRQARFACAPTRIEGDAAELLPFRRDARSAFSGG